MKRVIRWMAATVIVLAFACASLGASYTSKASGNYNADGTWNEGGNPGGSTAADAVVIDGPHTVTVTADYDASNDVVTVNSGGKLTTPTGDGKWSTSPAPGSPARSSSSGDSARSTRRRISAVLILEILRP